MNTSRLLCEGKLQLIEDIDPERSSIEEIQTWLENAIENLHQCLYKSAKDLWGVTNQSRRKLARGVCIKRSNRCTAQLRQLDRLVQLPGVQVHELDQPWNGILWPKWV